MKSNRGRKGGGGAKELGAGLKYSSRPEVGEGHGRRGAGTPRGPGEGGWLCGRRPGGERRVRRRQLDGPHLCGALSRPGDRSTALCGPGAGPTGGISCSAGAWPQDLCYLFCCAPATGEAGRRRCLEMRTLQGREGPSRSLRGLRAVRAPPPPRGARGVGGMGVGEAWSGWCGREKGGLRGFWGGGGS